MVSWGSKVRKRFIAGAVCPRCGEMDRMVSYTPEGSQAPVRECVACGFSEQLKVEVNVAVPTRVEPVVGGKASKPKGPAAATEQVIKFMPLPGRKKT